MMTSMKIFIILDITSISLLPSSQILANNSALSFGIFMSGCGTFIELIRPRPQIPEALQKTLRMMCLMSGETSEFQLMSIPKETGSPQSLSRTAAVMTSGQYSIIILTLYFYQLILQYRLLIYFIHMHLSVIEISHQIAKHNLKPLTDILHSLTIPELIQTVPLLVLLSSHHHSPSLIQPLLHIDHADLLFTLRCFLRSAIQEELIQKQYEDILNQLREACMENREKESIEHSLNLFRNALKFGAVKEDDKEGLHKIISSYNQRLSKQAPVIHPFACGQRITLISQTPRYYQTKKGTPFVLNFDTLELYSPAIFSKSLLIQPKAGMFGEQKHGHSLMVKQSEGMMREALVLNLMVIFKKLLEGVGIILWPYKICMLNKDKGLVQFIEQTMTIDQIKKEPDWNGSLVKFYESAFEDSDIARERFIRSLVGYSLFTFFCQVKDRHNGNILVHSSGCLIHIDFSYSLGFFPGKIMSAERAPFKLTKQYVTIMGGVNSEGFKLFKQLFTKGLQQLVNNKQILIFHKQLLSKGANTLLDDEELDAEDLIEESFNNGYTSMYDNYQRYTNGILP